MTSWGAPSSAETRELAGPTRAEVGPQGKPADRASSVAVGLALSVPAGAALRVDDPGHVTVLLAFVAGSVLVGPVVVWCARVWITDNETHQVVDPGPTSVPRAVPDCHSAAVMLACGVTFGVIALRWGSSWSGVIVAALATGVLTIGAVDVAVQRIPTILVRLTAAAVSLAVAASAVAGQRPGAVAGALMGALALWSVLGFARVATRGGLGGGDVRLGALLGFVVGWGAWTAEEPLLRPLSAVYAALVIAGAISVSAHGAAMRQRGPRCVLPFAPSLAGGALTVLVLS